MCVCHSSTQEAGAGGLLQVCSQSGLRHEWPPERCTKTLSTLGTLGSHLSCLKLTHHISAPEQCSQPSNTVLHAGDDPFNQKSILSATSQLRLCYC